MTSTFFTCDLIAVHFCITQFIHKVPIAPHQSTQQYLGFEPGTSALGVLRAAIAPVLRAENQHTYITHRHTRIFSIIDQSDILHNQVLQ